MKKAIETKEKIVHFIGIGGIGVSSLARFYLNDGWLVSGSDAQNSQLISDLKKAGAKIKIGSDEKYLPKKAELVIHSAAIPKDNPELQKASELKIKVLTYSQALGELTKKYKTIAIAGSHGKSTTTAMVAMIFIEAKLDPTVVIGTKLNGWNFRAGKSDVLIIEADEYTGAFWNYYPEGAIVTNIDLEHVDFYKNLTAVKNSFVKFLNNITDGGVAVLNKDDENIVSIASKIKKAKVDYFSSEEKNKIEIIKKILKVPGKHNISNALAAWHLAQNFGINEETIIKALKKFKGIWRRIEYKGKSKEGWMLYDDYAHHPTEIKASLSALREKFGKHNIVCVFQPHQSRRLVALYKDFVNSFTDVDKVFLFDTYNPKGRDEVSEKYNAVSLAKDINKDKADKAIHLKGYGELKKSLLKNLPKNTWKKTVIVLMGAGDIFELTPKLLKK